MYIRTRGKPSKLSIKLCKTALEFYGKKLLGNLSNNIGITVEFSDFSLEGKYIAYCEIDELETKPRSFIISIEKTLNRKQMLIALAHEMVHVKQYARGNLKDYVKSSHKSKWNDEILDCNSIDYWDYPWEIEAYGREKGLYVRFMESLKKK